MKVAFARWIDTPIGWELVAGLVTIRSLPNQGEGLLLGVEATVSTWLET